jgi:hypothetical protein
LEGKLQQQIIHEALTCRSHVNRGEYVSDTAHLDGEQLPYGTQVIHDYGPQISQESYFPNWHYDTAVELLDDSYDKLVYHFNTPGEIQIRSQVEKPEIDTETVATAYAWFDKTSDDRQPVIDDLGLDKDYYFFKTDDDAKRFMQEYSRQHNISNLGDFELVELGILSQKSGDQLNLE